MTRRTSGKYLDTGETFEFVDDFSHAADSHRILRAGWVGETEFHVNVAHAEENKLLPKVTASLNSLIAIGRFSGAGGRGSTSLDTNCHEPPCTHAVMNASSSDVQVDSTVCVGECQMDTDIFDRSYNKGTETRAEIVGRTDAQSVSRGGTNGTALPRTRVAQGDLQEIVIALTRARPRTHSHIARAW